MKKVNITDKSKKSLRFNQGKTKWSLVDFESLTPLVEVLEFGAKKYSRDNWKIGLDRDEILDSMFRHMVKLLSGEEFDEESKLHHIGHIMANAKFYSYHHYLNKKTDEG